MRFNVIRQFYKKCSVIGIYDRRLHIQSSTVPYRSNILEHSINKTFFSGIVLTYLKNYTSIALLLVLLIILIIVRCFIAKQILNFSNTFHVKGETKIMSGEGQIKSFIVDYNDILQAQKDDSILIIDVREPSEIDETGKLPGSIHIPSKLFLSIIAAKFNYLIYFSGRCYKYFNKSF